MTRTDLEGVGQEVSGVEQTIVGLGQDINFRRSEIELAADRLCRRIESLEGKIDLLEAKLCAEITIIYHKTITITAGMQIANTAILIGAMSYFMGGS